MSFSRTPSSTRGLREACEAAVEELFSRAEHKAKCHRPKRGETHRIDPGIFAEMPAFARVTQYERARRIVMLSFIAPAVLTSDAANALVTSFLVDVPALASLIEAHSGDAHGMERR